MTESPSTQQIDVRVLSVKGLQTQQDAQRVIFDYIPAHVECTVTFLNKNRVISVFECISINIWG